MRALRHLMYAEHPLTPDTCAGCCEVALFITIEGYQGDTDYPTCPEFGPLNMKQREVKHA